jgi:signal transduction histidine kinase/CheY-like chemotaxis protein
MAQNGAFWGVRAKLAALVCIAIGLAGAMMGATAVWQEASRYARMKRDTMLAIAHVLAAAAAKPTAERDRAEVYAAVRGIGRIEGFLYAGVVDSGGYTLADIGASEQLDSDLRITADSGDIPIASLLRSRTVETEIPIIAAGAEVGRLRLVADTSDLPARLLSALTTTGVAAGLALLLALALALPLQRAITGPLLNLTRAMANVRNGHDYAVSLPASANDEVGALVNGFNAMMDDIRDRDARLAQHREHLETEIADRTRDYRVARDAAESANLAKSSFLATMSHEIRTPMNGVLAMAEMLAAGDLPSRSRRYAEVIARSGQSLLAIINDILDFSKIEAGKLDVERLSVSAVEAAETVVGLFHERAQAKGLDLAVCASADLPEVVQADPVRLNQVLGNLVNNALKFTDKGHVLVTIARDPVDRGMARFTVIDTGIGIPKEKAATIFEAFSQADETTTRRFGGTGLGLSIANRLVTAMGGEIALTSDPGRGSAFSFSLPLAPDAAPAAWPRLPPRDNRKPVAVISIAGAASLRALSLYCEAAGYAIRACRPDELERDAAQADLVFADARLLGLRNARLGSARVVAVTDLGQSGEDALLADGVADTVLRRPFARDEIALMLAAIRDGKPLQDTTAVARGRPALPRYSGKRVLVADDSAVNREVALEALRTFGLGVDLVDNGQEALAAAGRRRYDLILLDGSMPVLDGYETARRLRASETGRASETVRTPIVALTAHVIGASADAWRAAGMDGVLHKPFTLSALGACLAQWIGNAEAGASAGPDEVALAPNIAQAAGAINNAHDPVLDPKTIAQLFDLGSSGRSDFVARVAGLFRSHAPKILAQCEEAHASGDAERLGTAAHALKSMSGNIGARRVMATAAAIEDETRGKHQLPAQAVIVALAAEIEAACTALGESRFAA